MITCIKRHFLEYVWILIIIGIAICLFYIHLQNAQLRKEVNATVEYIEKQQEVIVSLQNELLRVSAYANENARAFDIVAKNTKVPKGLSVKTVELTSVDDISKLVKEGVTGAGNTLKVNANTNNDTGSISIDLERVYKRHRSSNAED